MLTIQTLTDTETTYIIQNNFTTNFPNEIIKNGKLSLKGKIYSDDVKKFATTLYFYSPIAYSCVRYVLSIITEKYLGSHYNLLLILFILRSILSLPNPSYLRSWASIVDVNTGSLLNVLIETSEFPDNDKYCLILDSMSIKKLIQLDKVEHK